MFMCEYLTLTTEIECPAGQELIGDTCTACQSGFYKSQAGNEMCQECPTNTEAIQGTDRTTCRKILSFVIS